MIFSHHVAIAGILLSSLGFIACGGEGARVPADSSAAPGTGRAGAARSAKGGGIDSNIRRDQQFEVSVVPRQYQSQTNQGIVITRSQFRDVFAPNVVDPDNGVTGPIPLRFVFEYNHQRYSEIFVSVNGWISFENSGAYMTDDPLALFTDSRPNLTIAPYFGDHYLRTPSFDTQDPQGRAYVPSTIRVVNRGDTCIVEWDHLNINYRFDPNDPDNPLVPIANVKPRATSVASFQAWLIHGDSAAGPCGPGSRIEFRYAPLDTARPIKVSNCAVGIDAAPVNGNGQIEFMNAVAWREYANSDSVRMSQRLTRTYPPTGEIGQAFQFAAPAMCDTAFTFQLTWDKPNTDVDIYLIRLSDSLATSGDTVYWGHRAIGQNAMHSSASLDVDDIDGFGPETIRYRCATSTHEVLRIAEHYHGPVGRGGIPVRATIKMTNSTTGITVAQYGPCTIRPQEWWEAMTVTIPGPAAHVYTCGTGPHSVRTSRVKTVR